jgi:hypothetical protein
MERDVIIALAGFVAEKRADKGADPRGAREDYAQAATLLDHFTGSHRETEAYLGFLLGCTQDMFKYQRGAWLAVKILARALLVHETLSGKAAMRIVAAAVVEGGGKAPRNVFR